MFQLARGQVPHSQQLYDFNFTFYQYIHIYTILYLFFLSNTIFRIQRSSGRIAMDMDEVHRQRATV